MYSRKRNLDTEVHVRIQMKKRKDEKSEAIVRSYIFIKINSSWQDTMHMADAQGTFLMINE